LQHVTFLAISRENTSDLISESTKDLLCNPLGSILTLAHFSFYVMIVQYSMLFVTGIL
jgi:hypothetical protein